MEKELNEDARTKQELLFECSSLGSRLSDEIIKNEELEQQCKKQKEVIDRLIELNQMINNSDYVYSQDEITTKNLDILKEVSE